MRLRHRCFLVNFAKHLLLQNTSGRLPLIFFEVIKEGYFKNSIICEVFDNNLKPEKRLPNVLCTFISRTFSPAASTFSHSVRENAPVVQIFKEAAIGGVL